MKIEFIQQLLKNPFFQIINTIFGFIGLIILLYKCFGKKKKLGLFFKPTKIFLDVNLPEVKNTYNQEVITSLFETEFILWNKGKKIIEKSDFVTEFEIYGQNDKLKILDVNYISSNCDEDNIKYNLNEKNHLIIHFDYLKQNQGMKFKILHTGDIKNIEYKINSDSVKYSIEKSNYTANIFTKKQEYNLLPLLYLVITVILTTIPINSFYRIIKDVMEGKDWTEISSSITSILSLLINFSLVFYPKCISSIRKEFRFNIPKKLR